VQQPTLTIQKDRGGGRAASGKATHGLDHRVVGPVGENQDGDPGNIRAPLPAEFLVQAMLKS
jgi:hypothetical protein